MSQSNINAYKKLINEFSEAQSRGIVPNNITPHSQLLLTKFLEQAKRHVEIFSGELNEDIYGSPDVCSAASEFLERDGAVLDILLERAPDNLKNHPLIEVCQASSKGTCNVHQWDTTKQPKLPDSHFVVVDGKAWSFKLDKGQPMNLGCFNNPVVGKKLHESFAQMLESYSKPLSLQLDH